MKRTKKTKRTLTRTKKPQNNKELQMVLEIVRVCIDEYAPWYRRRAKELAIKTYNKLKNK